MRRNKHKLYAQKKLDYAMDRLCGEECARRVREALDAGAKPSAGHLVQAIYLDLTAIVRLFLEHGADPRGHVAWLPEKFTAATTPVRVALFDPMWWSFDPMCDVDLHARREEILDLFREYAPEAVMEAYCTAPGPRR